MQLEDSEQRKLFWFHHEERYIRFLLFKTDGKICNEDKPSGGQECLLFVDGEVDVSGITHSKLIELLRSQIKADEEAHRKGFILHPIHTLLTIASEFIEDTKEEFGVEFQGERKPNYRLDGRNNIVINVNTNLLSAKTKEFNEYASVFSQENIKKIKERSLLRYADHVKTGFCRGIDSEKNVDLKNDVLRLYDGRDVFVVLIGKGEKGNVIDTVKGETVHKNSFKINK